MVEAVMVAARIHLSRAREIGAGIGVLFMLRQHRIPGGTGTVKLRHPGVHFRNSPAAMRVLACRSIHAQIVSLGQPAPSRVALIGIEKDERGSIPRKRWATAKTALGVAAAVGIILAYAHIKREQAAELARGVTADLRPFVGVVQRSACSMLAYINHFERHQPLPTTYAKSDPATLLSSTSFPENERFTVEDLRGFTGDEFETARAQITELKAADERIRISVIALLAAASASNAGESAEAQAKFATARSNANAALAYAVRVNGPAEACPGRTGG
jgi:hypothetical protein